MKNRSAWNCAFTTLELLVILAIIALLAAVLLTTLSKAKERARQVGCLNNLKQLGLGSLLYAEDSNGNLSGASWNLSAVSTTQVPGCQSDRAASDADLNWLFPAYVRTFASYVCPSTHNFIRSNTLAKPNKSTDTVYVDLGYLAVSKTAPGLSYQCFGNFAAPHNLKKTKSSVGAFTLEQYSGRTRGIQPGAARIFLLVDADEGLSGQPTIPRVPWPDPGDHHGIEGFTASFCDGHAEFVPRSQWLDVFNTTMDSNHQPPP